LLRGVWLLSEETTMITLDRVSKEFDLPGSSSRVLVAADQLSLHVPSGEVFGLIGPNGAGKTTTLKMICGLLAPTSGTVTINKINVQTQPEEAQKHIGYLSDFFSVYDNLKVWEYVDYFARAYKLSPGAIPSRIREVIAQVGLETKNDAFIEGLSRGMKQRLGIARAIVHDPPVLILDEPTSGLDPKARVELKDLLRQLNREGKTILITSHILSDLQELCTSLGIIEKGKLLRAGTVADLMQSAGASRRIQIRLADSGFALRAWLENRGLTLEANANGLLAEFSFPGSDADLAGIVKDLVQAGAPLCAIEQKTDSLETVFSKISGGEVM
jgi:ABC-2 type transport system ATP-binding protein